MFIIYAVGRKDDTPVIVVSKEVLELGKHYDMHFIELHGHNYKTVKSWFESYIRKESGSSENINFAQLYQTLFTNMFELCDNETKCFSNYTLGKTHFITKHTGVKLFGKKPDKFQDIPYNL